MKQSMGSSGSKRLLRASVAGAVALFASTAFASQSFTSAGLGASATFTINTTTDTVSVQLNQNYQAQSLADLLSDIAFSITGGSNVSANSVSASGVTLITLTDGSSTVSTQTNQTSNPWTFSGTGGNYLLTGLNGGDQTATLIIGSSNYNCSTKCPDGLGVNPNPNSTQFNPYILQTATFNLSGFGDLTDSSSISNVFFSFGTSGEETCSDQSCTTVPIPAAVWLFGSGLMGLVGIARRRQVRNGGTKAAAFA